MADNDNQRRSRDNEGLQPVFRSPMQQMNDFFNSDPFGGLMSSIDSFFQRHAMEQFGGFPIDLYETSSDWVVKAELPGVRKEDIHIDTLGDRLRIAVINTEDNEVKGDNNYYRRERRHARMEREIPLPYRINRQKTKARFLNGVLEVRGPKYPKTRNTLDIE
ncbi:HSP20 family molecular chaperone IbpA [Pullulanibacillus pueri]|uniref:Molecular chaperone Hsp20 n=1 Tax=Pullulanibacillus pueri TaxID=1437324 RepID=A0A8J3ENU3_9BACL|nr:Hsp20/alpha crystallin family protein [Pullulanibacillus pueri]MBM7683195.1 HSP20 family molecular chaperone IbpA [Pullulanibacillus pueri]GGH85609.1 molecular chaperone Hsp20 [Pullulanibacillus pueri]